MQKNLSLLTVLCIMGLFLLTACGKDLGILQGSVRFKGLPCQAGQTDFNVPPCSGPYPKYEVVIFEASNLLEPVMTTTTDENGEFKAVLKAGEYVIRTQNGPNKRNNLMNNPFTIIKEQITSIELKVSTGIQ